MIVAIALALIFIIIDEKQIGKGLVLGTLFSVINFIIMGQLLPMKLLKSRSKASAFSFLSIVMRFGIMAVPLIISIRVDAVDFVAVVVGLFMVQLMMFFDHLILNRLSSTNKV